MPRKKTKSDLPTGKPRRKSTPSEAEIDSPPRRLAPLSGRRLRAAIIISVLVALGVGSQAIWRRAAPTVASRDRYLLPAEKISISDPPEWIVADIRGQVIQAAGLDKRLSVMDPQFLTTIHSAFALHPWVAAVEKVEKSYPPAVHVTLSYRKPVAVVETPQGEAVQLLPVDAAGVHLPAEDVPLIRRQYLPRIMNIVGQPPAGQRWDDPRVAGGVELAIRLADVWEAMHLVEIVPSARPDVQGEHQFFVYELVTRGGTHVLWGAAPYAKAPNEAGFAVKLERLEECIRRYGPLDEVTAPGTVNVRGELEVKPRMVKKPPDAASESVVK